jgi:hypothetical protein
MDNNVYVLLIADGRRDMQSLLQRRLLAGLYRFILMKNHAIFVLNAAISLTNSLLAFAPEASCAIGPSAVLA